MSLRTKEYFIREAFVSIRRNGLMSIAAISTVAISLLVLGLFLVLVFNINNMASMLESQVQITVYVKDEVSADKLTELKGQLTKITGVTKVGFTSKEQAMKDFRKRLGEQKELLDSLGDVNPLPNSFAVHVDKPENLKSIAEKIRKLENIESMRFGQEIIEQLFKVTYFIRVGGLVLIVFLTFATLFIISNTIRLTVFARRKEVSLMKYVGATDWFIRWPFLLEGMMLGLIGGVVAFVLIGIVYSIIVEQIHSTLAFMPILPKQPLLSNVSILIVFLGMTIGATGSFISLKKFLKV
ncbi:permease-like cell division protein FtsX [Succinispira mobilis]|uniref:permease-like cell division protein FtsX n=1 Tax=Succinispira mobilis TaxID=78120 RepID=UPI00037994D0|nr:permease-like cell division protein FtsX [Succinispira mobilis]